MLNKTQFKELLMGLFERVDSGKMKEGYIFVLADEHNQEKLFPIQEQTELTWKTLAEAHLRERVRNPHDYRALSIELEGMKNAGFPWEKEFNHNLSQMVRFINKLYQAKLVPSILWNRIESISDRHLYRIQEATDYWRNFRQFLR